MKAMKVYVVTLILSLTARTGIGVESGASQAVPLISIAGKDLPGRFDGVMPEGIDISPDNSKVAVLFEVGEEHGGIGIWVGIWELSSKRLLESARVDGPLSGDEASNPQFVRAVRFSPDGQVLVVQTGPRMRVVDAETLALAFSVQPPRIMTPLRPGEAIRSFDVSAEGRRLAVLTSGHDYPNARVAVQVVDLLTGRTLAEWQIAGRSRHISLSPDGSRVVLDATTRARGFSLIDSMSGQTLRNFDSGWPMGSGTAIFVDSDQIAAIPAIGTDEEGKFFGAGLRVFSANSGRMLTEIRCQKFGSTASLAAALREPVLVTVNAYQTPREVRSDTRIRTSKPELVIFRLSDGTCHSILKPVPHGQFMRTPDQYSLRLSPDASLVALFETKAAKVYRVPRSVVAEK